MPVLNKIRLHQIAYNNNNNLIRDLVFDLQGDTTLMNLENGGGKTVMNQLCHAPYLFGKDRKFGDRPFEDLFTQTPSFVLHEWNMDDNAGRFIVGLMLAMRYVATDDQESRKRLVVTGFIEEFPRDLQTSHIEDYILSSHRKTLSYKEATDYLNALAADKSRSFRVYNLTSTAPRRQYQERLESLGISFSEWKQMRTFNQEESGIAQFASRYPTSQVLLEKVLIPAVEEKLDSANKNLGMVTSTTEVISENIKDFAIHMANHKEDLENYAVFSRFLETLQQIEQRHKTVEKALADRTETENAIQSLHLGIQLQQQANVLTLQQTSQLKEQSEQEKVRLQADQISWNWHELEERRVRLQEQQGEVQMSLLEKETEQQQKNRQLDLQECAYKQEHVREIQQDLNHKNSEKERIFTDTQEADEKMAGYGSALYQICTQELEQETQTQKEEKQELEKQNELEKESKTRLKELRQTSQTLIQSLAGVQAALKTYDQKETALEKKLDVQIPRKLDPYTHEQEVETLRQKQKKAVSKSRETLSKLNRKQLKVSQQLEENRRQSNDASHREGALKEKLENAARTIHNNQENYLHRQQIVQRVFPASEVQNSFWNDQAIARALVLAKEELQTQKEGIENSIRDFKQQIRNLKTGTSAQIDDEVRQAASRLGIQLVFASSWMREGGLPEEKARQYIQQFPLLPFALIVSAKEKQALLDELHQKNIFTSQILPVLDRDFLEKIVKEEVDGSALESYFYANFNQELLNPSKLEARIDALQKQSQELEERRQEYERELNQNLRDSSWLAQYALSQEEYLAALQEEKDLKQQLDTLQQQQTELSQERGKLNQLEKDLKDQIHQEDRKVQQLESLEQQLADLIDDLKQARSNWLKQKSLEEQRKENEDELETCQQQLDAIAQIRQQLQLSITQRKKDIQLLKKDSTFYAEWKEYEASPGSYDEVKAQFEVWRNDASRASLKQIESEIDTLKARLVRSQQDLEQEMENRSIKAEELETIAYDAQQKASLTAQIQSLQQAIHKLNQQLHQLVLELVRTEERQQISLQQLEEKTGLHQPLARDEIRKVDWQLEIKDKENLIKECEKEIRSLETQQGNLEATDANLLAKISNIDFSLRPVTARVLEDVSSKALNGQAKELMQLIDHRRMLFLQTVSQSKEFIQECRKQIDARFDKLTEILGVLTDYAGEPERFRMNFERNRQLVENHLANVQQAKDEMDQLKKESVDHIYQHVFQLHQQLNRIDSSMTIELNGSRMKMLNIELPSLEQEEESHKRSIDEYVQVCADELVAAGMNTDTLWKLVTPQKLFELVIPARLVRVKVRKFEEFRQSIVAWEDVAKLSGAESFLSCMTVMLAVLYYQRSEAAMQLSSRKHQTTIFMDNPFAYVQSKHILAPLLELLKKTGTQMIALSKVENAAIIRAFPNLYFLQLRRYADQKMHMEAEHKKAGGQPVEMDSVHILEEDEPDQS